MEEANDPEARVHVLVQLKTDMSALNEMDGESHFVGRDENLFCRSSCA